MPAGPVLSAVLAVGGTAMQLKGQSEARSARREERKQQQLVTRRERRQSIRQAMRLRAQSVATAAGTGATGSSALAGGLSSLSSQVGEGLGFSTQGSAISANIGRLSERANLFGTLGGLGTEIGTMGIRNAGGWGEVWNQIKPLDQPNPRRAMRVGLS